MGSEPLDFQEDGMPAGGVDRDIASADDIRARVQALVDDDPGLRRHGILIPLPKATASESMTGCNWTMHYLGQFGGLEPQVDAIVETVQHAVNIGRVR